MNLRCKDCGSKDPLDDLAKRWIIRLYEEATGKVLLPKPGAPRNKEAPIAEGSDAC